MATAFWGSTGSSRTDESRLAMFVDDTPCARDVRLTQSLAAAAVAGDDARVDAALGEALTAALSVEAVLVGPVTDAARRLGDFWIEDSCDFVAVTMAIWQLRCGVERMLGANPAPMAPSGRRALFAAAPGDQHGFGTFLVNEVFVRGGWLAEPVDSDALTALVAEEWVDLVGLTATADRHRSALAPVIAALRRASRNPQLVIVVGGRVFAQDSAIAAAVGADGTAGDAVEALALADRLVAPLGPPC